LPYFDLSQQGTEPYKQSASEIVPVMFAPLQQDGPDLYRIVVRCLETATSV
jgi:hypothetical protein